MITQKELKQLVDYRDGNLYWRVQKGRSKIGDKLGCKQKNTRRSNIFYVFTRIDQVNYRLHRLIWLWHYGYLPAYVDHINGDGSDNRIENLRACSQVENSRNAKLSKANTSGYKNVSKQKNKWLVQLNLNGKNQRVGLFVDIELAALVAQEARNKYFGDFAKA